MLNKKMFMMAGMMMTVMMMGVLVVGGGVFMQGKLEKIKVGNQVAVNLSTSSSATKNVKAAMKNILVGSWNVSAAKKDKESAEKLNGINILELTFSLNKNSKMELIKSINVKSGGDELGVKEGSYASYTYKNLNLKIKAGETAKFDVWADAAEEVEKSKFNFYLRTIVYEDLNGNKYSQSFGSKGPTFYVDGN